MTVEHSSIQNNRGYDVAKKSQFKVKHHMGGSTAIRVSLFTHLQVFEMTMYTFTSHVF